MVRQKVLTCAYGTHGDVEPFLALGLRAAGCDILLATSSRFGAFVGDFGVPFFPMSDDSLAAIESRDGKTMLEGGAKRFRRVGAGFRLARRAGPINDGLMREIWEAAASFAPDVIVFNAKLFAAPHVAEKLRIPPFLVTLQPMIVPTRAFPMSCRDRRTGRRRRGSPATGGSTKARITRRRQRLRLFSRTGRRRSSSASAA